MENIRQDIAINDKASKSYVNAEIAKVHTDTTPLLPRDGSRSMTSDLDMDDNHILYVKNLNDYKVDDAYEVRVRDLKSVVNKEYLNEKFLKVDKNGNYFDLKQNTIKNCEPYYDGLFDDNSLVSKAFVDAVYGVKGNVNNVSVGLWDRLYYYDNDSIEYEVPIDMKGKKITGLGDGSEDGDAVNKLQVDTHILHVVTQRSYFYFTTDLKHNETDTVKFPTNINKYPFSTVSNNNESHKLILSLDGYYKITYTDFHMLPVEIPSVSYDGFFKIYNSEQSNKELFSLNLKKETNWAPLTINAVIKIEKKDPSISQKIHLKLFGLNSKLIGSGFSTFFIRYLYPLN